jgi:ABC-2 type transport system ATP-binding protein
MRAPIIELHSLVKTFDHSARPCLGGINLRILQGEKFGIFGPNGAGKTTLISILCNIIQPTSGEVRYYLHGEPKHIHAVMPTIGFVPQEFAFYPELTPSQSLHYFGALYDMPKRIREKKIDILLDRLSLTHVRHKRIQEFSGGMKRRMNLAIGLINDPSILFLDEPTVGVDVQSKSAIIRLLDELNRNGTTILYTSHHLKEAEDFCDRIALLDQGQIIALDTLPNLLQHNKVGNLEELLLGLTGITLRDS